jgi:hypothetical protein
VVVVVVAAVVGRWEVGGRIREGRRMALVVLVVVDVCVLVRLETTREEA